MKGCFICSTPTNNYCKNCQTLYCSNECQKEDWINGHKDICFKITPYESEEFDTNNMILHKHDGTDANHMLWGEKHIIHRLKNTNSNMQIDEYKKKIGILKTERIVKFDILLEKIDGMSKNREWMDFTNLMGAFLTPQLSKEQFLHFEHFLTPKVSVFLNKTNRLIVEEFGKKHTVLFFAIFNILNKPDDEDFEYELEKFIENAFWRLKNISLFSTKDEFAKALTKAVNDINSRFNGVNIPKQEMKDLIDVYTVLRKEYDLRMSFIKQILKYLIDNDLIAVWGDMIGVFAMFFTSNPLYHMKRLEKKMWDLNYHFLTYITKKGNVNNLYPSKVGNDVSKYVTLKKNTILYRAFGETSFEKSWQTRKLFWFGFDPISVFAYVGKASFYGHEVFEETGSSDATLNQYIQTLGKLIAVRVVEDIRLPNIKNIDMVNEIIDKIKRNGSEDLMNDFSTTVFIEDGEVNRKSYYELDGRWAAFLCSENYNGFIANAFSTLREEVAICDFRNKVEIVKTYTPFDLDLHFTNKIYSKYTVSMRGRSGYGRFN